MFRKGLIRNYQTVSEVWNSRKSVRPRSNAYELASLKMCHLAEALAVNLRELQTEPEPEATVVSKGGGPRSISNRSLHRAYLQMLLTQKVGSAYVALSEEELEGYRAGLSWEAVLEVLSSRRREAEFLREMLKGAVSHPEVRLYFEKVLSAYPDQDIRLIAAARSRERSEKGREELTRAMRELL